MDVSLKITQFHCLFLLSSSYAVGFPTGLVAVGVWQHHWLSFLLSGSILYYLHFTNDYKQVSANKKRNRNKNIFKTITIHKVWTLS